MSRALQCVLASSFALALAHPGAAVAAAGELPLPETLLQTAFQGSAAKLGAGHGHVVTVLATAEGGELVELQAGQPPRHLRNLGSDLGTPTVGLDRAGRPVAVVSPCLQVDRRGRFRTPGCSLIAVRIDDGSATSVPRSAGAYIGAVDRGDAVVARRSDEVGARVAYLPAGAGAAKRIGLDRLRELAGEPRFAVTARVVDGLSLRRGVVGATVHADFGGGYGLLLRSSNGRPWQFLARAGYGEASGIPRVFRAPSVTKTGVRAYYDGGDNDAGWAGRWNATGKLVKRVATRPYGVSTINPSAAWDGERLIVGTFDYDSASEEPGLVVTSHGPIPLG